MVVNMIMDALQSQSPIEKKEYHKTKFFAKSAVVSYISFAIFLVIGLFSFFGAISDKAISEAKRMEFCDGVSYEELIDTYLKDSEWTAFNAETDTAVVEITGTSVEGENICIQFWGDLGMGLSYSHLTLEYFEVNGMSIDPQEAMEYIYLYYYLHE